MDKKEKKIALKKSCNYIYFRKNWIIIILKKELLLICLEFLRDIKNCYTILNLGCQHIIFPVYIHIVSVTYSRSNNLNKRIFLYIPNQEGDEGFTLGLVVYIGLKYGKIV